MYVMMLVSESDNKVYIFYMLFENPIFRCRSPSMICGVADSVEVTPVPILNLHKCASVFKD